MIIKDFVCCVPSYFTQRNVAHENLRITSCCHTSLAQLASTAANGNVEFCGITCCLSSTNTSIQGRYRMQLFS